LAFFTELAEQPLDGQALTERLRLHPRSVRDFLDALVALGMLERGGKCIRTPQRPISILTAPNRR
jgi:DNA-binding IclR family transcriptional regulator